MSTIRTGAIRSCACRPPPLSHLTDAVDVRARPSVRPPLAVRPAAAAVAAFHSMSMVTRQERRPDGEQGMTEFSGSSILHGLDAPSPVLAPPPHRHAIAAKSISECNYKALVVRSRGMEMDGKKPLKDRKECDLEDVLLDFNMCNKYHQDWWEAYSAEAIFCIGL
ncbi:hypothetical protein U9M48_003759 [Paspalum notatum var. saurae]|uniref:Uncharacterized protein n=1 Tax=Paspalum notatum var. saurae TaxID=547442 RepID=A0AAQ3SK47_PASNO